jgi:hypothetical protein
MSIIKEAKSGHYTANSNKFVPLFQFSKKGYDLGNVQRPFLSEKWLFV